MALPDFFPQRLPEFESSPAGEDEIADKARSRRASGWAVSCRRTMQSDASHPSYLPHASFLLVSVDVNSSQGKTRSILEIRELLSFPQDSKRISISFFKALPQPPVRLFPIISFTRFPLPFATLVAIPHPKDVSVRAPIDAPNRAYAFFPFPTSCLKLTRKVWRFGGRISSSNQRSFSTRT